MNNGDSLLVPITVQQRNSKSGNRLQKRYIDKKVYSARVARDRNRVLTIDQLELRAMMAAEPLGSYVLESASSFPDALMPYNDNSALGAYRRAIAAEVASGLDLFTGDMLRVGMTDVITNDNATSGMIQWNFSHVIRAIEAVQLTTAGVRPDGTRDPLTLQILGLPPAIAMAQIPLDQQIVDADGFTVPLPWSAAAISVASSMYSALANTPIVDYSQVGNPTVLLKDHPTLTTIVAAPIGARGFRSEAFAGGLLTQTLPSYDRDTYASALLNNTKAITDAFPNDFSYMQWFGFNDGKDSLYSGQSLNTRMNNDFSAAFNGVGQPSFGIFRENLGERGPAASSAPLLVDFETPDNVFTDAQGNVLFQALSTWIAPFPSTEITRFEQTNSGSPANGMMVGYSEFDARYFEHYSPDFELTTANIRRRFADDPAAAPDPDLDILTWDAVDTDSEVAAIRQTLLGLLADWNVYLVGGPKLAADSATVLQGSSVTISVLANDTPPPGLSPWDNTSAGVLQLEPLKFKIRSVTQGSNGRAAISADELSVVYTPNSNFSENDVFSYTISDGAGGIATASVNVTVSPSRNRPPVALSDSFTVNEDSAASTLAVLTNDSDPDANQSVSILAVSSATYGSLAITSTGVSYKPNANFNGVDTFTYTVSDGHGGTATATVNVTVTPRGSTWNNTLTGPLPVGVQHLSFLSNSMKTNVGFSIYLPPSYSISPTKDFPVVYWLHGIGGNENGSTSVVSTALAEGINEGIVSPMIIVFVNGTAPLAPLPDGPDTGSDPDDGGKVGTFYTDSFDGTIKVETSIINELIPYVDSNFRTIESREGRAIEGFSMGGYGALRLAAKYPEMFSSVVTLGGALLSASSLATRNAAEYAAIFGSDATYATNTNPRSIIVANKANYTAYGVDYMQRVGAGDTTVTPPIQGDPTRADNISVRSLLIANVIPNDYSEKIGITHSPSPYYDDWLGSATFQFHSKAFSPFVKNSASNQTFSGQGSLSIAIPSDIVTHPVDKPLSYTASLTMGAELPSWLTFNSETRTFSGNPPASQSSPISIRITATDQDTTGLYTTPRDSASTSFQLTLTGVNDVPNAVNDRFSLLEDQPLIANVATNDIDLDLDTLTFSTLISPTNGTLTFASNGSFTYQPRLNFSGSDTFTYAASDGQGGSATATVSLTVNPVNDAPETMIPTGTLHMLTSGALVFSSSAGSTISIRDIDAGSSDLQIEISAPNSILILTNTVGLTAVSGNETGDLKITGSIIALNAAMDGLSLRIIGGYTGLVSMLVTTSDLGNAGAGGSLTSVKSIQIDVGLPPKVVALHVRSQTWHSSYLNLLASQRLGDAALGYSVPDGPTQGNPISWSSIDTLTLVFSKDVSINSTNLVLNGSTNGSPIPITRTFTYSQIDSTQFAATWTFSSFLPSGKYLASLTETVTDTLGFALDGEWMDGVSTTSGNGIPGGNFTYRINVLHGDFNASNSVSLIDYAMVKRGSGRSVGDDGFDYRLDMDGSSSVGLIDIALAKTSFGKQLLDYAEPINPMAFDLFFELFGTSKRKLPVTLT
jgi:S-formylglutathione hydrolase FrmB